MGNFFQHSTIDCAWQGVCRSDSRCRAPCFTLPARGTVSRAGGLLQRTSTAGLSYTYAFACICSLDEFSSAPDTIRTCDLRLRRASLYPSELQGRYRFVARLRCCRGAAPVFDYRYPYIIIRAASQNKTCRCPGRQRRRRCAARVNYVLTTPRALRYNGASADPAEDCMFRIANYTARVSP